MAPLRTLGLLGLLSLVSAAPADIEQRVPDLPTCTDFKIPVAASAKTLNIEKVPTNLDKPDVFADFLISSASALAGGEAGVLTNGTYMMAGRYCEPMNPDPAKADTIFYMQHAITMRKEYWTGLTFPLGFQGTKYSMLRVASETGYPVVAFDNLGSGSSEHPDPITVVQQTLQVEIIHQIIQKLRKGEVEGPIKGKKYSKVIYAGHSYGSIIGNAIATHHPKDVDAFVLTGYSGEFDKGAVPLAAGALIPAALVHKKYEGYNPGYLAMSSVKGRRFGLYTNPYTLGGFAPGAPPYDFKYEGTVAVGEIATLLYGVGPADEYEGSVLAITGQNDAICCNDVVTNVPHCGHGESAPPNKAKAFFPKAKMYETHMPDLTGHDANIHLSSPESFGIAMAFLKKAGL